VTEALSACRLASLALAAAAATVFFPIEMWIKGELPCMALRPLPPARPPAGAQLATAHIPPI
jgi:hypothetical protein